MTPGKLFLLFIACAVGASWHLVEEYRATGSISAGSIGLTIFTFVTGLCIVAIMTCYVNKPEK
jgi:hypothetical protein